MVDTFPGVWSKVITMVNQQKRKTHKKAFKWGYSVSWTQGTVMINMLQLHYSKSIDNIQTTSVPGKQITTKFILIKFRLTPKVHASFVLFRKKCIEISRSWRHTKQSKYDFEHNAPKYYKSEKASWSALLKFHLGQRKDQT